MIMRKVRKLQQNESELTTHLLRKLRILRKLQNQSRQNELELSRLLLLPRSSLNWTFMGPTTFPSALPNQKWKQLNWL